MSLKDAEAYMAVAGGVIAGIAAIVATFKALTEWKQSNLQRAEELAQRQREFRHKQAIFARELSREVFADPEARDALNMLDWLRATYEIDGDKKIQIERKSIQHAMRTSRKSIVTCSPEDKFIRTRFASLYDFFEQIENFIHLDIINFADVEPVFRYYVLRIHRKDVCHEDFLKYYDYPNAQKFLMRFNSTRKMPELDEDSTQNESEST